MDRLRGSNAVGQFSRVVWALNKPNPDAETVRLEVIKSNWGARPKPLGFTVGNDGVVFCDAPCPPRTVTVKDQAAELLLNELTRQPQPQRVLLTRANDEGISEKTLRRAAKELGIVSKQRQDGWYWSLPGSDSQG